MRRARPSPHGLTDDLALLGLEFPRLKARDYPHGCELLEEWKAGPLKAAYRAAVKRTHPDKGGTAEEFNAVKTAYERARRVALRDPATRRPPRVEFRPFGQADADTLAALNELLRGMDGLGKGFSRGAGPGFRRARPAPPRPDTTPTDTGSNPASQPPLWWKVKF